MPGFMTRQGVARDFVTLEAVVCQNPRRHIKVSAFLVLIHAHAAQGEGSVGLNREAVNADVRCESLRQALQVKLRVLHIDTRNDIS